MADPSGLSRVKGESQEGKRGEKRSERIPFGERREGKEEITTSWWKCGRVSHFKPGHKSANSSHSDLDLVFDMMCVLKIKKKTGCPSTNQESPAVNASVCRRSDMDLSSHVTLSLLECMTTMFCRPADECSVMAAEGGGGAGGGGGEMEEEAKGGRRASIPPHPHTLREEIRSSE